MCPSSLRTTALPPPQTPLHPSSSPSPNPLDSRRPPRPRRSLPSTAPPSENTPWQPSSLTPGVNGIRYEDSKYVPLTSGYDADDEYETSLRPDARQSADRCQAKTPSSQLELPKSVGLYLLAKGYQLLALMPVLQSLGLGKDGPQDMSALLFVHGSNVSLIRKPVLYIPPEPPRVHGHQLGLLQDVDHSTTDRGPLS